MANILLLDDFSDLLEMFQIILTRNWHTTQVIETKKYLPEEL